MLPKAPTPSTINESWAIGVWKPCIPPPIYTDLANAPTTCVGNRLQVMLREKYIQLRSSIQTAEHPLLDNDTRTLSDQEEVGEAMHNHRAPALLDNIWKHRECWRETRITVWENIGISTQHPVNVSGCVNCCLDVLPIEIQRRNLSLEE
jgi:hypothetical protein